MHDRRWTSSMRVSLVDCGMATACVKTPEALAVVVGAPCAWTVAQRVPAQVGAAATDRPKTTDMRIIR